MNDANTDPVQSLVAMGESNTLRCRNLTDAQDNPTGGYVHGTGITVVWQDGPRGKIAGFDRLAPANGAFVEDLLAAAHQRLAFFQQSKFVHADNAEAMKHIEAAIAALGRRADERRKRGVLGQNTV